jgi:hypothetical protein
MVNWVLNNYLNIIIKMKLKSIHILSILVIIIGILGIILLFVNKKEKYENAKVVVLNAPNLPPLSITTERENNIFCDTSTTNNQICLDIFKINHPRTMYDVNNL